MTSKVKLLVSRSATVSEVFQYNYWSRFFDLERYNSDKQYPPDSLVIIGFTEPCQQYLCRGLRVIVDHLFDCAVYQSPTVDNNILTLYSAPFMWIHEFLFIKAKKYNIVKPPGNPDKFFLLAMNLRRGIRDDLLAKMTPYLEDSYWSYVGQGRLLPGDVLVRGEFHNGTVNDRHYISNWYTDTCFSLVSETAVDTETMGLGFVPGEVFISEKSFKPLSYWHPFVTYGTRGTLQYMRSLGFETFGSIIDESYDTIVDSKNRLNKISQVVDDLYKEFSQTKSVFQTPAAQDIVQHNYHRFWDAGLVDHLFLTQIVEPIVEFAES